MARVARFYAWSPAVVLGLSLRELTRWDDLRVELRAEEHLEQITAAGVWHLEPQARKRYVDGVRALAQGQDRVPRVRGTAAKQRFAALLATPAPGARRRRAAMIAHVPGDGGLVIGGAGAARG
jgi:hypothetical protein